MEVENYPKSKELILEGPIFHFHDCGRKGRLVKYYSIWPDPITEAGTMLVLIFSLTPKGQQESHRIIEYTFASLGRFGKIFKIDHFAAICLAVPEFHVQTRQDM